MPKVAVQIVKFTDSAQPSWVECVLRDAAGRVWTFVEKVPIVSQAPLDERTTYPQPGVIACEILKRRTDEHGRVLFTIDTNRPDGVAATTGETQFEVCAEQVTT